MMFQNLEKTWSCENLRITNNFTNIIEVTILYSICLKFSIFLVLFQNHILSFNQEKCLVLWCPAVLVQNDDLNLQSHICAAVYDITAISWVKFQLDVKKGFHPQLNLATTTPLYDDASTSGGLFLFPIFS